MVDEKCCETADMAKTSCCNEMKAEETKTEECTKGLPAEECCGTPSDCTKTEEPAAA